MFNFTYSERSKPALNSEGYNNRVGHMFPKHPYIYRSVGLLRVEYAFQQHKTQETFVHMRKLSKNSDNIDARLARLLEKHANEEISDLQLAISCGKAVKKN
jgi:hypothetical protein